MGILLWIEQLFSDIRYELRARKKLFPKAIYYPVPYVCQYARAEDVERIVKGYLRAIDDPHWKLTGARSSEEYARWSRVMCGMSVAAMIIHYFKNRKVKLIPLAKKAYRHGVYSDEPCGICDMRYREFSVWIQKYGIRAEVRSRLSIRGIQYAIAQKKLVIASVNPNIRGYSKHSKMQKGGHLVLVTGYDAVRRVLFLNNPSGFLSLKTQKRHKISEKEFRKYYAGRGILVSPM